MPSAASKRPGKGRGTELKTKLHSDIHTTNLSGCSTGPVTAPVTGPTWFRRGHAPMANLIRQTRC